MRITLDIPDEIHAWLKARAKDEGTTMRAIILEGLELVLSVRSAAVESKTQPALIRRSTRRCCSASTVTARIVNG
jgi:hypothetical protein